MGNKTVSILAAVCLAATSQLAFSGEGGRGREGWGPPRQGGRRGGGRDFRNRGGEAGRPDWGGPGRGGCRFPGRFFPLEELGLDPAQKTRLVEELAAGYKVGLEARLEIRESLGNLRRLRNDPNASGEAIVAANAALGEAKGKLEASRRQSEGKIRALLTPEQLERLDRTRREPPFRGGDWRPGCRWFEGGDGGPAEEGEPPEDGFDE
ncbi:MAG: hypothetical protein LBU64_03085 [Planctomycetota bacterium]|nr:hypothetical protein [Planctomycetota bacterium]